MLELIAQKLIAKGLVGANWAGEMQVKGELVKLYRDYYDGNHRLKLTNEMRQMMQIKNDRLDQYNANYCEMVVSALADRLTVESVDSGNDAGDEWVKAIMTRARFDALQIDVREAALRDGETFVMVAYDEQASMPVLAHEPAWDGDCGVMVVYDRQMQTILAGVKVWYEGDLRRVNIYYPASMEKYSYEAPTEPKQPGGEIEKPYLKQYPDKDADENGVIDMTRDGQAPGVPIVHFPNRGKRKAKSELGNMIPLQDSLNSTLVSMVMSALLTAFSVLFAKGWKPPAGMTPGMILYAMVQNPDGTPMVSEDKEIAQAIAAITGQYDLKRIEPGELEPLIRQADWIIYQIGTVTSTPVPSQMGADTSSGEALKQRSINLVGKAQRAQTQLGNAWEDVFTLAARQQAVFGAKQPPAEMVLTTRWKSAEIRNNVELLAFAKQLHDMGFTREALRLMSQSSVKEYTDDDIDKLIAERTADEQARNTAAISNMPDFGAVAI